MPLPLGQGPAPSPAAQVLGELPLPATRHPPHLPRRSPPPPLPLPMVLERGGLCRPFCPGERCPWPVLAWSPVAGPGTRTRGRGFGRVTPGRAARRRPRCKVASWHEVCCQACRWRRRASRGVRGVPPGARPLERVSAGRSPRLGRCRRLLASGLRACGLLQDWGGPWGFAGRQGPRSLWPCQDAVSLSVPAGLSLTATAATAGGRGPQCILPTPPSSPDSSTRPFLAPGLGQTPLLGLLHVPHITTACLSPLPWQETPFKA